MLSASVHVFLFGSPFSAFGAKDTINEYIDKSYIGEAIEKSEVRYDRHLGRFVCDINSISEPTEIFTVSLKDGKIEDTFRDHVEISLMNGKRLEIVNSLRESFPNESFSVVCNSIQNFHFVKAGITDGEDRSGEMVFDVYISAYLTPADFISKAESYTKVLEDKGIKYSKINFYGGRAGKYYRRLTLLCSDLPQNTKIEFVPHCFADLLASRLIRYDLPGTEIK